MSAATGGRFEELVVKQDNKIVGRLPYVLNHRGPFRMVRMPPFTHVLGPAVDTGTGKPQTRLIRRLSITRSLIDQLPPHSYFHQHLDPTLDEGLANADGLAFQERQFLVAPQYNFEVDCRRSLADIWAALYQKTRQQIRRAEGKYSIHTVDDSNRFVEFYLKSVKTSGRVNRLEFKHFSALFSECQARDCGVILGAFDQDGAPIAMTFLVWGHGIKYYLLSMRSFQSVDYGSVGLLLWSAIKEAQRMGLIFDLDGVYSSGTARFLSGFGGQIKTRLVIRRGSALYSAMQSLKRHYAQDETQFFT